MRAVGAGQSAPGDPRALVEVVARTRPDRLCITTPQRPLIGWALRRGIRTSLQIADSFAGAGPRVRWRNWLLARLLRRPGVEWVGNHGLNACLSLLDIGVPPAKVVPWDWPPSFSPHDAPPRTRGEGALRIVYVGSISEAKGVGDLVRAVALLRDRGTRADAAIYGNDPARLVDGLAGSLGVADRVRQPGPIANEDVVAAMRAGDVVVVPSRRDYPEGLPLTIYEALSSRTPLVASDHPMFRGAVVADRSALVFEAGRPAALADALGRLDAEASLYARLSAGGLGAWDALQLPVRWGDLLGRWLADTDEDRRWLAGHAIASGRYDARLAERRAALAGR